MALTYNNRNTASEFLQHDYLSVHVKGNEVFKSHGETGSCFDKTQPLKESKWRLQRPGGDSYQLDHPLNHFYHFSFRAWSAKADFSASCCTRQRTAIQCCDWRILLPKASSHAFGISKGTTSG